MNSKPPDGPLVMVVEDELLIAASLEMALEAKGYRILGPVATVDAALALLENSPCPDMAVIDYRLATTTTEALIPALKENRIPVCVLTGYAPSQLPTAYDHLTVLEKPFRLKTLLTALEHLRAA
ncbi:response regulator [Rhodanobacter sp. L36]|uniref:response regulator n=1 Tax=Rhodanobacter sp. L36 TaxID=1747221 RepID=UPI00131E23BE|nr:response regulator [Rhodanobacter sp. L36]